MIVHVNNLTQYEKEIKEIAKKVMSGENLTGELSITFINDDKMIELNQKYTGRKTTTDVLSFSFEITEMLGDIYISFPQANRQKGCEILSELKLLTVHGILHLAGYDDNTEEGRKKMKEKEKEYIK